MKKKNFQPFYQNIFRIHHVSQRVQARKKSVPTSPLPAFLALSAHQHQHHPRVASSLCFRSPPKHGHVRLKSSLKKEKLIRT